MDPNFFSQNLQLTKQCHPDLWTEIQQLKQNEEASLPPEEQEVAMKAQLSSIWAHSRLLIFFGFGRGNAIKEALFQLKRKSDLEILVIEKSLVTFHAAMKLQELSEILKNPRLTLWVGQKEDEIRKKLRSFFLSKGRGAYVNAIQVVAHPTSAREYEAYFRQIENWSNQFLLQASTSFGNSCEDAFLGEKNALFNSQVILESPRLSAIKDQFKNIPALLIASGPSLEKEFETLKELQTKALLICADSALKPLLDHGIKPHIVTAIERIPLVAEFFKSCSQKDLHEVNLASVPILNPEVYQIYSGPRFNCFRDYSYFQIFNIPSKETYTIGPSCAHLSFLIAKEAGCNPLIFVGQDLAYSPKDNRSHLAGTAIRERDKTHRAEDLLKDSKYSYVKASDGQDVLTEQNLNLFRQWFEKEIGECQNRQIINTSASGAKIEGAELQNLEEVAQQRLTKEYQILDRLEDRFSSQKQMTLSFLDFGKHLKSKSDWLKQLIQENMELIERLQNCSKEELSKQTKGASLRIQKLANEDSEFRALLMTILTPYLYQAEIQKNIQACELGPGKKYELFLQKQLVHNYEEINKWAGKLVQLIQEIDAK